MSNLKKVLNISLVTGALFLVISYLIQMAFNQSDMAGLTILLFGAVLGSLFVVYVIFSSLFSVLKNYPIAQKIIVFIFALIDFGVILWSVFFVYLVIKM